MTAPISGASICYGSAEARPEKGRARARGYLISPLQPAWPHSQAISAVSLCDSQWGLQYFWSVMQEQAGWAHFFVSAIYLSLLSERPMGDPSAWMRLAPETLLGKRETSPSHCLASALSTLNLDSVFRAADLGQQPRVNVAAANACDRFAVGRQLM